MGLRIRDTGDRLVIDSAPWGAGAVICLVILGAAAMALTGALSDTVPALWWWVSAGAGVIAFAAFVSRETLCLDATAGEARFVRRTLGGARAERAALSDLGPARLHERRGPTVTDGSGGGGTLRRMEVPVAGQPDWALPDAFVGGSGPERAVAAVAAFRARLKALPDAPAARD